VSGWLPQEDKRYGQDVLIPQSATAVPNPARCRSVQPHRAARSFGQPGRPWRFLAKSTTIEIEIAVRKYRCAARVPSDEAMALARTLPGAGVFADKKTGST
jgi:ribonuclease R